MVPALRPVIMSVFAIDVPVGSLPEFPE